MPLSDLDIPITKVRDEDPRNTPPRARTFSQVGMFQPPCNSLRESDVVLESAQEARYMHRGGFKYGFLSTHRHTIFLKQEMVNGPGHWTLF